MAEMQYFYDKQVRRYIQQFIRLFSGFSVQMGESDEKLPVMQKVPVRYGDINRMAAHITRENSENIVNTVPFISCYINTLNLAPERRTYQQSVDSVQVFEKATDESTGERKLAENLVLIDILGVLEQAGYDVEKVLKFIGSKSPEFFENSAESENE